MKVYKTIPSMIDDDTILNPRHRYSVYGNQNDGNVNVHKSFKTYQEALDYYTRLRDEGTADLMLDDNYKQETLANNEL